MDANQVKIRKLFYYFSIYLISEIED